MSRFAWDRENAPPFIERDPTSQSFSVNFWQEADVRVDRSFASYVEGNQKSDLRVGVRWYAMWDPDTALSSLIR